MAISQSRVGSGVSPDSRLPADGGEFASEPSFFLLFGGRPECRTSFSFVLGGVQHHARTATFGI